MVSKNIFRASHLTIIYFFPGSRNFLVTRLKEKIDLRRSSNLTNFILRAGNKYFISSWMLFTKEMSNVVWFFIYYYLQENLIYIDVVFPTEVSKVVCFCMWLKWFYEFLGWGVESRQPWDKTSWGSQPAWTLNGSLYSQSSCLLARATVYRVLKNAYSWVRQN